MVSTSNPLQKKEEFLFGTTLFDWNSFSFLLELDVQKADGSRVTVDYFPRELSNAVELLWMYQAEIKRGPLREQCTKIRKTFDLLQIPLDSKGEKSRCDLVVCFSFVL